MSENSEKKAPIDFTYWDAVEKVAMHFNDLILRLRLQALAGVGLIASFAAGKGVGLPIFGFVCLALAIVWWAIWMLDVDYYMKLLYGAVEELFRIEKELPCYQMSTKIEEVLQRAQSEKMAQRIAARFYGTIFTLLIVVGVVCLVGGSWRFLANALCGCSSS